SARGPCAKHRAKARHRSGAATAMHLVGRAVEPRRHGEPPLHRTGVAHPPTAREHSMKPAAWPVWVRARAWEYRLTYLLVILVFMMFVAGPLVKMGVLRAIVVDLSFVLLLVVGVATLGGRRELTMVLAVVGGLALIAHLLVV